MTVGLRVRATDALMDTVQRAAIRLFAARGEELAKLLTPKGLADPYPLYEEFRRRGPVVRNDRFGIWAVMTYELASVALRDPHLSVDNRLNDFYGQLDHSQFAIHDHEMMLRMDPPDHTRIRRLVGHAFVPRAVASWRPMIEKLSAQLLDSVDMNNFDLIDDYAVPLTVKAICQLLGVPDDDWRDFRRWGDAATRTMGANLSRADQRASRAAMWDLFHYFSDLIARRRSSLGDDLLSVMIAAEEEGERLSDRELVANAILLLLAGFETTVNLIGNGTVALLAHPDQWEALRAEPALVPEAVEELLRYDSPVQFTSRNARETFELAGETIPKGKVVGIMLAAANNDPDVFAEPRRLDVTRTNARNHLAFASGAHYCLGASLARLEGEVALRALTERYPHLHAAARPRRRGTDLMRGYAHVPVAA